MLPKFFGEPNDKDTQFTAALKKYQDFVLIGGVFLLIILVIIVTSSFTSKRTGTWRYGLCSVFLERYVQYPTNLKILTTGEKQNSAQIGYLTTNSYGSRESQLIECFFNTGNGRVSINKITLDRKPLPEDAIKEFNKTIPIIMARDDLNLNLPPRLSNAIEDLQFE
jgi:hypothetical protein